jgi:hypothetical protein
MDYQHSVMWRRLSSTLKQVRKLISGPRSTVKTRLLSVNSTRSRIVTGPTGQNTLRRHLHLMGLIYSPLRRCEEEEETAAHNLCECEVSASLRHAYLGSLFLDPENIKSLSLGAIWNFSKGAGFP